MADGVRAQPEPLSDRRVRESFRGEKRDLRLASPEPKADPQLPGRGEFRAQPIHQDEHAGLGEQSPRGRMPGYQPIASPGQIQLRIIFPQ
jgi:hypothetical protein